VLLAGDAGEDEEGVVLATAHFGREADGGEAFDEFFEPGRGFGSVCMRSLVLALALDRDGG